MDKFKSTRKVVDRSQSPALIALLSNLFPVSFLEVIFIFFCILGIEPSDSDIVGASYVLTHKTMFQKSLWLLSL